MKKKLRLALCSADSVAFPVLTHSTRNGLPDHTDPEGKAPRHLTLSIGPAWTRAAAIPHLSADRNSVWSSVVTFILMQCYIHAKSLKGTLISVLEIYTCVCVSAMCVSVPTEARSRWQSPWSWSSDRVGAGVWALVPGRQHRPLTPEPSPQLLVLWFLVIYFLNQSGSIVWL